MKKTSPIHFHIISLFPEVISPYLETSIIGRALNNKKIKVSFYNPRDFAKGKLKKEWPDGNITTYVDDRPYGGGPGMVLRPEPVLLAAKAAKGKKKNVSTLLFSASGGIFTNKEAEKIAKSKIKDIILISGRYEGIDARVDKILKAKKISIGPYVLTGGEIPALVVIDAVARRIPGVLGKIESVEENRISSSEVYTRPEELVWKGKKYKVPKVLKSGNTAKIESWKKQSDQK